MQIRGLPTAVRRRDLQQGGYPSTVATTWEMSFQKIEAEYPAAAEAMRACAYLVPEGIPVELFVTQPRHRPTTS